ncbi:hypothetical protein DMUE_4917 [Dictyocoela muelleri]|nr:hypothetical protein DMUE_4917 [Dictyocoela muelleri]
MLKYLTGCSFVNIIIDFEIAQKSALCNIFPLANLFRCSFHFGQSIWRSLQRLNLSSEYLSNSSTNNLIRNFLNLAFVPKHRVEEVFYNLQNKIEGKMPENLNSFIKYFQKTYVGENNKKPLFVLFFWNCNFRVLSNIPMTTNSLEPWHRSLNF